MEDINHRLMLQTMLMVINKINIKTKQTMTFDPRNKRGSKSAPPKCLFRPVSMTTEGDSVVRQAEEDADDNIW